MNKEELIYKMYCQRFGAAVSVRYHQVKYTSFGRLDKIIRVTVGVVAVFGVIASILGLSKEFSSWTDISAIVSIVSLTIAFTLNIFSAHTSKSKHRDLLRRWNEFLEDAEREYLRAKNLTSDKAPTAMIRRLEELTTRQTRINGDEESPDAKLIYKCYKNENLARTGFATHEEKEKAVGMIDTISN